MIEPAHDGLFEPSGAVEAATADRLGGDQREPTFDQIDPRGTGWSEVQVEAEGALPTRRMAADLVGAVVIQDQMDFERRGYGLLNGSRNWR